LEIRKATYKDVNRISYLIQKNTDENPNNYTKIQLNNWKKHNTPANIKKQLKTREVFCAFENNKLIGTIALVDNEIMGFYVSFSKRGNGIGAKLLKFIEEEAKQKNIKTLYLTATLSAELFYKSKGFQKTKDNLVNLNGINYNEVDMQKELVLN